jgi:diguanylate cyclase (GGDEF)-like protein/PAS domain S-box-containing protein
MVALEDIVRITLPLLALAAALWYQGVTERLDHMLYDSFMRAQARSPAPEDIVVVAIDADSLARIGRWPWSRRVHAELIERLTRANARVIAFDVAFTEPDALSPQADARLAQAMRAHGAVVLPVLPEKAARGDRVREALPLPSFVAAARLGHDDIELDADGVVRRVFLNAGTESALRPALALAVLDLTRAPTSPFLPGIRRPDGPVSRAGAWIRDHAVLIGFGGPPPRFRTVSFADVLASDAVAAEMRGKVVLVGVTALGMHERFLTPVSGQAMPMSGVELQAHILESLREDRWIHTMGARPQLALAILAAFIPAVLFPWLRRPLWGGIAAALLLAGVLAAAYVSMQSHRLWWPPTIVTIVLATGFALWLWRGLERTTRTLSATRERFRATLQSIGDAVIVTDPQGRVRYMNPAAETMLGRSLAAARGSAVTSLLEPDGGPGAAAIQRGIRHCARTGAAIRPPEHIMLQGPRGARAVRAAIVPLSEKDGARRGDRVVISLADVTETVALSGYVSHLATHDPLTGLPNRSMLSDRLQHALASSRPGEQQVALLYLELDGLKRIHDTFGPRLADGLLREVGRRLELGRRPTETVARWGDDEFMVMLQRPATPEAVDAHARAVLAALDAPFSVAGQTLHVSAHVGLALADGTLAAETLLKNAAAALRRAKHRGANRIERYADSSERWTQTHLETDRDLRRALERGELTLHYQPQVSIGSGHIVGVEALVRWKHPEAGWIEPARFIPIAEESDLILRVGEWVLRTACAQAARWHREGLPDLRVAVNVSPRQFMRSETVEMMRRAFKDTGVDPARIVLELTESVVMQDVGSVARTLQALKDEGVRISVDDFGTGYSSLSHLKQLPIDHLKIDQSFVRDITTDTNNAAITEALVAMAHSMAIDVVAEGVETEAQLDFLRSRGCDHIQGYYFSPPLPAEEITAADLAARTLEEGLGFASGRALDA